MRQGSASFYRVAGFLVVFLTAVIYMGSLGAVANVKLEQSVFASRTTSHARALQDYLGNEYIEDSVSFAFESASHDLAQDGGGLDAWSPDGSGPDGTPQVPRQKEAESLLEEAARQRLRDKFFPGSTVSGYGSLTMPSFHVRVTDPYGAASITARRSEPSSPEQQVGAMTASALSGGDDPWEEGDPEIRRNVTETVLFTAPTEGFYQFSLEIDLSAWRSTKLNAACLEGKGVDLSGRFSDTWRWCGYGYAAANVTVEDRLIGRERLCNGKDSWCSQFSTAPCLDPGDYEDKCTANDGITQEVYLQKGDTINVSRATIRWWEGNATAAARSAEVTRLPHTLEAETTDTLESMRMETGGDRPITVNFSTEKGGTRMFLPPEQAARSKGNRYFYLYNVTQTLARSQGFRSSIADTVLSSSHYIVGENEERAGTCNGPNCEEITQKEAAAPAPSRVIDAAENLQEQRVDEELQDALDDYYENVFRPNTLNDPSTALGSESYGDITVDIDVVGVEYNLQPGWLTPVPLNGKNAKWRVSTCERSDYECKTGSYGCDDSYAEACGIDDSDIEDQYCQPTTFNGYPSDGGSTWTQDPWRVGFPDGEKKSSRTCGQFGASDTVSGCKGTCYEDEDDWKRNDAPEDPAPDVTTTASTLDRRSTVTPVSLTVHGRPRTIPVI
ncbi:MAG: hypothetical protein SVW77_02710, partial [Candidatus Nanohaloarchaea archaeon]|nr:hypothetical protein [Candidatus Nanohaloarchaea archaeon]